MHRQLFYMLFFLLLILPVPGQTHHVLGRPAYSLNEDSNTPSSMQIETQIGDYFVTMMAFPAFPKPKEKIRIKLHAIHRDKKEPFLGKVSFSIRDDTWFPAEEEPVGVQTSEGSVFSQGMIFSREGDYIVRASFVAEEAPYLIDFPVRIGNPVPLLPLASAGGVLVLVVAAVSLRKRTLRARRQVQE